MSVRTDVSILLPVYNVESYIKACIESIILHQRISLFTYEIICIDDASTDNSYFVLEDLAKKYSAIKLFRNKKNQGICYTRNLLLKKSQGTYIHFVDPDDMIFPNTLDIFLKNALHLNADVILGNYIKVSDNYLIENCKKQKNLKAYKIKNIKSTNYLPRDLNDSKYMCAVWCGLFKRKFLIDNMLYFREGMIAQEDTLFYFEFLCKAKTIYKSDMIFYLYRQRPSSIMHVKNEKKSIQYYKSMLIMYDVYKEYLKQKNYYDKTILEEKILHTRENIVMCLAMLSDTNYIKQELSNLKKEIFIPIRLDISNYVQTKIFS